MVMIFFNFSEYTAIPHQPQTYIPEKHCGWQGFMDIGS
jgi:hypothetical protein